MRFKQMSFLIHLSWGVKEIWSVWQKSISNLHGQFQYVASNILKKKMPFHIQYIYNLFFLHEHDEYVPSNMPNKEMPFHIRYIYGPVVLHVHFQYVTSNILKKKMTFHIHYICDPFFLDYLHSELGFSN